VATADTTEHPRRNVCRPMWRRQKVGPDHMAWARFEGFEALDRGHLSEALFPRPSVNGWSLPIPVSMDSLRYHHSEPIGQATSDPSRRSVFCPSNAGNSFRDHPEIDECDQTASVVLSRPKPRHRLHPVLLTSTATVRTGHDGNLRPHRLRAAPPAACHFRWHRRL